MKETKTIAILFSTYTDFASKIVYLFSLKGYTHVSLALDTNNEYFYAFNTKGFRKEFPKKHKKRTKNNICFHLEITNEQYKKLQLLIQEFKRKESTYTYSWLGLIFCLFRFKYKEKNKYFCSQFIATLLEKAEILKLKKDASKYLPNELKKELATSKLIKSIKTNCFKN